MVFDAAHGETILFASERASLSPDQGPPTMTWAWTGTAWVNKQPATSPPFRFHGAMAFDGATGKVVLFGGYQCEADPCNLSDTWLWDGTTWTQAHPSSSPHPGIAYSAYDEKTRTIWLLDWDGTMWSWSGANWVRHGQFTSMAYRYPAVFVYDGSIGKIVLYGGKSAHPGTPQWTEQIETSMWAWDGTSWTLVG